MLGITIRNTWFGKYDIITIKYVPNVPIILLNSLFIGVLIILITKSN